MTLHGDFYLYFIDKFFNSSYKVKAKAIEFRWTHKFYDKFSG